MISKLVAKLEKSFSRKKDSSKKKKKDFSQTFSPICRERERQRKQRDRETEREITFWKNPGKILEFRVEKWFLWKRFQFLNVCSDTPWIFSQLVILNNSSGWIQDTQTTAFFKKLETILGKIFEFISVFEVGFPNSFCLVQKIWTLQHVLEKKISFINTKHRVTTSKVKRVGGLLGLFLKLKKSIPILEKMFWLYLSMG